MLAKGRMWLNSVLSFLIVRVYKWSSCYVMEGIQHTDFIRLSGQLQLHFVTDLNAEIIDISGFNERDLKVENTKKVTAVNECLNGILLGA